MKNKIPFLLIPVLVFLISDCGGKPQIEQKAGESIKTENNDSSPQVKNEALPNQTEWGRQLGTSEDDSLISVTTDYEDNVLILGITNGQIADNHEGKQDIFFIKYNTEGDELYRRQFGSAQDDGAGRICCDNEGNIFIAGETAGNLVNENAGQKDAFIAKFTKEGDLLWICQFGTDKSDNADDLLIADDKSIYVTGGTFGQLGDSKFGSRDGFVTRISAEGKVIWNCQFGTSMYEYGRGIRVDTNGTIYAVASYFQTKDSTLAVISKEGKLKNQKEFKNIIFADIQLSDDNQKYLCGFSGSTSFFVKIDKNLDIVWKKSFTSGSWSGEKEIVSLGDGRLATAGCMNWPDCYGFVRVYDPDGNLEQWISIRKSFAYSDTSTTCGMYLAADSKGAIYHVGITGEKLYDEYFGGSDGFLSKIKL